MNDKAKYWLELCDDDLDSAKYNLNGKKLLWTAFICHLIVEKSLKAVIAQRTNTIPPKIHNLVMLAEKSGIKDELTESRLNFLEQMNNYHIETRYPEDKAKMASILNFTKCEKMVKDTEDFLCWIKSKCEN